MEKVEVSIIIVTFNSADFIVNCLKSIKKWTTLSYEIILVDNNSKDHTKIKILQSGVKVNLLEQKENLGFAKANNLAAKQSNGEYLFFLNPDTKLLNDVISLLVGFLKDRQEVGIIAPQLIDSNDSIQKSVRRLPTILGAVNEFYFKRLNFYEAYIPKGDDFVEVESVVGAAMLIRKDLFIRVGMFNEKYFMYYEDLELCKKVLSFGKKVYYCPKAKVFHLVGAAVSEKKSQYILDSAKIYHGAWGYFLLNLILRLRPKQ